LLSATAFATLSPMSRHDAKNTELAVARLGRRLAAESRLQGELRRARREFFGAEQPAGERLRGAADTAEHRFVEWFGLERDSDVLGAVPAEVEPFADEAEDLLGSMAGVYLVQATAVGGASARDLQDESILDLWVPEHSLQAGDLVVGRLFPAGSGAWTPSTAAAVFRPGAEIGKAFLRDVKRLDLGRRLYQVELEHLLLRRPDQNRSPTSAVEPSVPLEHLEAELERMLQLSGSEHSADVISEQLAVAVRPGPVMGPLLDELAFDTELDLDRARALMLQIWNAHHETEASVVPGPDDVADGDDGPPGETLGERLVRTLETGLQQKRDIEELFAQLERQAGLAPGAADEQDDDERDDDDELDDGEVEATAAGEDGDDDQDDGEDRRPSPRGAAMASAADDDEDDGDEVDDDESEPDDDASSGDAELGGGAGNLLPLVEEYLWETEQSEAAVAVPLRAFAELQQNAAVPHQDLEQLEAVDVMRFLLHIYLAAAPTERAAAVRRAYDELGRFCTWAATTQEMTVGTLLESCQGPLLDQLDRLQQAGLSLSSGGRPGRRPGILLIEDVEDRGFGVRDDDGDHHWLVASADQVALLQRGDLVIGAISPGPAGDALVGPVVVLPSDARALME
jgi:hypothetical protein